MKGLMLIRRPGTPVADAQLALIADSALSFDRRPMALPDIDGLQLLVGPVYRIGRLGKAVAARFAPRYIDALTVGAVLCGPDGIPLGHVDHALALGTWREGAPDLDAPLDVNGTVCSPQDIAAAEALERVSRMATLKTGDLIIPAFTRRLTPRPGMLTLTLDGLTAFSKKVI